MSPKTKLAVYGGGALVLVLLAFWGLSARGDKSDELATAVVERGSVTSSVTATGSLSALVTVEVGSQLSGQIKELFADFNSEVMAGEVIARIDPVPYETKVAQAEAELAIAQASVAQAEAGILEAEATLTEAQNSLKRSQKLRDQGNLSESNLDAAVAKAKQSEAGLASAKAQRDTAEAQVKQRQASLESARVDLEHTYIRSPVNGVVIGRTVDVGQTVAASLQTPILFTIAQDLSKMQVEVSVDEADIGQVTRDQKVTFSVDAYPDRNFNGRVEQIRKAPVEEQNVVTYTVIVSADNTEQKLLPGMTANVEIIIARHEDALKVPTRTLSFHPPTDKMKIPDMAHAAPGPSPDRGEESTRSLLWLVRSGKMTPVRVTLGLTGGGETEILSGDIHEGDQVVLGSGAQTRSSGRDRHGPPRMF